MAKKKKMTEDEFVGIVNSWSIEKLVLVAEDCTGGIHDFDRSDIVDAIVESAINSVKLNRSVGQTFESWLKGFDYIPGEE